MLDFYIDDGKAKHTLLKAIWDNKDRLRFTFFREEIKRQCRITLDLGEYSIQAVEPLIMTDSYIMFNVYKRKMFGLYKSYLGSMLVERAYNDSLEALVSNYVYAKLTELRKSIDEAAEAARRKINDEFIDYLKENCSASD